MTNSLIDLAIADLHKGGYKIAASISRSGARGHSIFNRKTLKKIAQKASPELRVSLRSAHRFSVTEEMQLFCKDMAFRLRETELDALIENATPPFESAFFENMPCEGLGVLVERARWNPIDLFFPSAISAPDLEFHHYDDGVAFSKWSTSPSRKKQEAVVAEHALPNSKDHPVYFVQIISKGEGTSTIPNNFGFYFCPNGYLWKPWPKITVTSEVLKIKNALMRGALPLGGVDIKTWLTEEERQDYSLPIAMRKVALSTTGFFPLYVGLFYLRTEGASKPLTDLTDGGADWMEGLIAQRQGVNSSKPINYVQHQMLEWVTDKLGLQILSLLSTLNFDWIVDGTEPGEEGQRVRVEPDAPFNSHSEIQINLPKEKGVELALEKFHRASPLGIRRHWVRAHNRVIRKDGVPVKVIRVSEHQRGDAKLGTVTHDYVLERQQKKKED